MGDDSFIHDEAEFEPAAEPSSVDLSEAEAKYAELVAQAVADGKVDPDERGRLDGAIVSLGLDAQRAARIEQAQLASIAARPQAAPSDDEAGDDEAGDDEAGDDEDQDDDEEDSRESIAPLAPADDPRLQALQRRIAVVEKRNAELLRTTAHLREHNKHLEQLVARMRHSGASATAATEPTTPSDESSAASAANGGATAAADEPSSGNRTTDPGMGLYRSRRVIAEADLAPPVDIDTAIASAPSRQSRTDPSEIHRLVRHSPRDVELLRALFRALKRSEDVDRRWCIAHALNYLGEANDEEQAVYARHAPAGVVRPKRAVNEDEWNELLRHPDENLLTGEILAEIAPAVLLGQLSSLRAKGAAIDVDPEQILDPKKSGIEAVRCFSWAAALLGLRVPPLCTDTSYTGTVQLMLSPKLTTRLGRQALVSRSSKELAFMAGRHLSWYRREHVLAKLAGSVQQLEDVFLAALLLGNPGLPIKPEVKERVAPIAETTKALLKPGAGQRLKGYFARFVEHGGRTNLLTWLQAADRTATCAGMVLANDLQAAEAILALESKSKLDARIDELIVFFTAGRCSLLRHRIGIAVGGRR